MNAFCKKTRVTPSFVSDYTTKVTWKALLGLHVPPDLILKVLLCTHSAFLYFVWVSEKRVIVHLFVFNNPEGVCLLRGAS